MRSTRLLAVFALAAGIFLAACSAQDEGTRASDSTVTEGGTPRVYALYEPGVKVFPMPNDIVWAQSPTPGNVYLPISGQSDPLAQLKTLVNSLNLKGLTPNPFLVVPTSGAVDPGSVELIAFRADGLGIDVRLQNAFVRDFAVDASNPADLKIVPKEPFAPGAKYAVAVKRTLLDASGYEVYPSLGMDLLLSPDPIPASHPYAALEPLRQQYQALVAGVGATTGTVLGTAWTADDILAVWTFQTAAATVTGDASGLMAYADILGANGAGGMKGYATAFPSDPADIVWLDAAGNPATAPVLIPATAINPGFTSVKYVVFGNYASLNLPGGTSPDPSAMVPFLITVPDEAAFEPPWEVVLYQHAITGDKTHALAVAEALAIHGFATVAIDAPFHGDRSLPGMESGTGFFTTDLLADRRNVFQGAIDLWELTDLLSQGLDLDGVEGADLETGTFGFAAHSLGSIIGSVYLSQEDRVDRALMSSPSSVLTNVLDGSTSPNVAPLVDALGLTRGTVDYYVFLNVAQWLLDPVDSAYAKIGPLLAPDDILVLSAFGDPTIPTSSTRAFEGGIGLTETDLHTVVPADVATGTFPALDGSDFFGGAYEYGYASHPVTHDFLVTSNLFDDPRYAGYIQEDQDNAHLGALLQMSGFFYLPFTNL